MRRTASRISPSFDRKAAEKERKSARSKRTSRKSTSHTLIPSLTQYASLRPPLLKLTTASTAVFSAKLNTPFTSSTSISPSPPPPAPSSPWTGA